MWYEHIDSKRLCLDHIYWKANVDDSTVWIYLFFLPFQLVNQFGYYAIPGVAIASFIYLGFIAAGEEIEQPFGEYPVYQIIRPFVPHLSCNTGYDEVDFFRPVKILAHSFFLE